MVEVSTLRRVLVALRREAVFRQYGGADTPGNAATGGWCPRLWGPSLPIGALWGVGVPTVVAGLQNDPAGVLGKNDGGLRP